MKKIQRKRPKSFNSDISNHARLRRKWRRWLPHLKKDIADLLVNNEIFWELQEIAEENKRILSNPTIFIWMCRNYVVTVSVGVRRLANINTDNRSSRLSPSLWRMLYEILEYPGIINRNASLSLWGKERIEGNRVFDILVGQGKRLLTQKQILKDLRNIEDTTERVYRFVNKKIAHFTQNSSIKRIPTFTELESSLKILDEIFCKYNMLLTGEGLKSVYAPPQNDWTEVFEEAWILPGSKFSSIY
ncbi:MAG: hypothetical protein DWQ05_18165 [Calditrichaeota bacterium]|nr:MAG: hypothetical protein DWQ05_18165 [Calditrichota bacterium]